LYLAGALLMALFEYLPEPAKVVETPEAGSTRISGGAYVATLSAFFLLWFTGGLRSFLMSYEGGAGRLSSIAFAGGVAAGAMVLMSSTTTLVAAQRIVQEGGIDPGVATLAYDLSLSVVSNGLSIAMAAMIAATAVVSLRTRALRRWFGWVSAALAIGLLTPYNWVVLVLVFPWVVAVSVWIYLKTRDPQTDG
jgi:hypothetical protein